MNRTFHHRTVSLSRRFGRPTVLDALEWEELPSLTGSLRRNELGFAGSVWNETQRMDLQTQDHTPPATFAEPIDGLHVREIDGADVFCHFFGSSGAAH